jgi:hypothetical protein
MKRLAFWLVLGLLAAPGNASGAPRQAFDDPWKICLRATQMQERLDGLPQHLLTAISKAESGRWDEANRANVAWPWTVTSGGEGKFFATRGEALAEVRRLKARGVSNIDVGCMQINLHHHGHHFASLEQAMDPEANAAYAARFLRSLHAAAGDWTQAAANYHSTTPERNESYKAKVVRLWDETKRENPIAVAAPYAIPRKLGQGPLPMDVRPLRDQGQAVAPIDGERTAFLNARFRQARAEAAKAGGNGTGAGLRERQLAAWREGRAGGNAIATEAAARRSLIERDRLTQVQKVKSATAETQQARLAERRTQQLNRWRLTQAAPPAADDGES